MSKSIKRDEKGCPILQGAQTFGTATAKPMGGRKQPRHYKMREKAANYFASLADHGHREPPPLDPEQIKFLQEHNEFARLPNEVKATYYYNKWQALKKELEELEQCGNQRKITFMRPVIQMEIEMMLELMAEIYEEMEQC
ncbi:MAG: hypothetical protein ACWGQW_07040 [bacterium]